MPTLASGFLSHRRLPARAITANPHRRLGAWGMAAAFAAACIFVTVGGNGHAWAAEKAPQYPPGVSKSGVTQSGHTPKQKAVPAQTQGSGVGRRGQPSPQGHPGQIDTTSGGAPPESPQGDAPSGMQPRNTLPK